MKKRYIAALICLVLALVCLAAAIIIKTSGTDIDESVSSDESSVLNTDISSLGSRAGEESSSSQPQPEAEPTVPDNIRYDSKKREMLYDVDPIVRYYFNDSSVVLTEKQQEYLEKAKEVLAEITTDDMSNYEKELAIHDHLILNNSYDYEHLSPITLEEDDDSSSPYGVLINGNSVCKGYAVTFELLCKMCGIDCMSLVKLKDGVIDHAYNCVQLDGSWYYVDVTWDDNKYTDSFDQISHRYFNLTDRQFKYNHWLGDDAPVSDSYKYCYAANNYIQIGSVEDFANTVSEYFDNGNTSPIVTKFDKESGVELKMHNNDEDTDAVFGPGDDEIELYRIVHTLDKSCDLIKIKCNDDIFIITELRIDDDEEQE
ncbi:MAG: hypothetical protein IJ740_02045 [Ruminococcus sp.]|nr:hypothetical protein [Ruminococcus sp.]